MSNYHETNKIAKDFFLIIIELHNIDKNSIKPDSIEEQFEANTASNQRILELE